MNEQLSEEDLKHLEPLVSDLKHEVGNPLQVLEGHLELEADGASPLLESPSQKETKLLREFNDTVEDSIAYAELFGTLRPEQVDRIEEYASDSYFPENLRDKAQRIASVSRDVFNYQETLVDGEIGEKRSLQQLLEPLENCAENIEKAETDFKYNGLEGSVTRADSGRKLLFWTLGKNWEQHSGPSDGKYELGFEVTETDEEYVVDVWNTGEGFFGEIPGAAGKSAEHRYRKAYQMTESEELGGHGLKMASDIADVYEGEFMYSEERLEDTGCGWRVMMPKYQSSTSDSS